MRHLAPTPLTETEFFLPSVKSALPKYASRGARVLEGEIRNIALFYEGALPSWNEKTENEFRYSADGRSPWIKRGFSSQKEAREFCYGFILPADIKEEANALSRDLVRDLIQSGGMPRVLRDRTSGRFDCGRMPRVIRDLQRGNFSVENTRPFKTRERVAPSRPHVGICIDGSWAQFNRDESYVPRVVAMAMGVAWACEAVNCPITVALVRNNNSTHYGEYDLAATPIVSPSIRSATSDLAVVFHPQLYRCGTSNITCQTIGNVMQRYNMTEAEVRDMSASRVWNEASANGGTGVAYLKAKGATITVAIGVITDSKDATIALEAKTPLRDAVKVIAETLAKQNRAMGVAA